MPEETPSYNQGIAQLFALIARRETSLLGKLRHRGVIEACLASMGRDRRSPLYLAISQYIRLYLKLLAPELHELKVIEDSLIDMDERILSGVKNGSNSHELCFFLSEYREASQRYRECRIKLDRAFEEKGVKTKLEQLAHILKEDAVKQAFLDYHHSNACPHSLLEHTEERADVLGKLIQTCVAIQEYQLSRSNANYQHFKHIYESHLAIFLTHEKLLEDARDELLQARHRLDIALRHKQGFFSRFLPSAKRETPLQQVERAVTDYVAAVKNFQVERTHHLECYRNYLQSIRDDRQEETQDPRMLTAFTNVDRLIAELTVFVNPPFDMPLDKNAGYFRILFDLRQKLVDFIRSFDTLYHTTAPTQYTPEALAALNPFDERDLSYYDETHQKRPLPDALCEILRTVQATPQELLAQSSAHESEVLELAASLQTTLRNN